MPISHFKIPSSRGMYYMNGLDDGAAVVQGGGPFAQIVGGSPFVGGFGWSSLNPLNVLRTVDRYSPHSLLLRRLNKPGSRSPAAPAPSAPPTPAPPEDAGDGSDPAAAAAAETMEGVLLGMLMNPDPTKQRIYSLEGNLRDAVRRLVMRLRSRGHSWRHRSHRAAAATAGGWSWGGARDMAKKIDTPAGRLLISAVPYGATALQARQIAQAALRSGDLRAEHLQAAGNITRAARGGDEAALVHIARVRKLAGQGHAPAEKALDTLKLANVIQTGRPVGPSRSGAGSSYNRGLEALRSRAAV